MKRAVPFVALSFVLVLSMAVNIRMALPPRTTTASTPAIEARSGLG